MPYNLKFSLHASSELAEVVMHMNYTWDTPVSITGWDTDYLQYFQFILLSPSI
jgi:hypothetical protein